MFVYIAAFALLAFYLAMVPLKIAFVFHTHPQPELSSGTSIFESRFALRRALRKKKKAKRRLPGPAHIGPALKAGKYLLRRIHPEQLRARGVISEPDAANTALICGAGETIRAACTPLGGRVVIDLTPDFSGSGSRVELVGMISVRAGHIILTALLFALEFFKVRFGKWITGIRLKASCTPRWKTSAI